MPVQVIGADRVAQKFKELGNISNAEFINTISQSTLSLLRNNTPVDTGELRDSWREILKTDNMVEIGVDTSQIIKLKSLVFGTRYIQSNDFITPVTDIVFENIESFMRSHLKRSHPYLKNISGGTSIKTPSDIVGLTGLKYNRRRGRGRSYIGRTTLKAPQLRPTIRRRRRV